METILTNKQINSIFESTSKSDIKSTNNVFGSYIMTEATSQEDEDFSDKSFNPNMDVDELLFKCTTVQETITKNILYISLKTSLENDFLNGDGDYSNTYRYSNLNTVPDLTKLNTVIDTLSRSFAGYNPSGSILTLSSVEKASEFIAVCKSAINFIMKSREQICSYLGNTNDAEDFGTWAYRYYRDNSDIQYRTFINGSYRKKAANTIKSAATDTNKYTDSYIATLRKLNTFVSKLRAHVSCYNKQLENQAEYAKKAVKLSLMCFAKEYLCKANILYAAKAEALSDLYNIAFGLSYTKPAIDLTDNDVSSLYSDNLLDEYKITLETMDMTGFLNLVRKENGAAPIEIDYSKVLTEGGYLTFESACEIFNEQIYDMYIKPVMEADGQATTNGNSGGIIDKIINLWKKFWGWIKEKVLGLFKRNMESRIKQAVEFMNNNKQKIMNNVGHMDPSLKVTWQNYDNGIKSMQSNPLISADTYINDILNGKDSPQLVDLQKATIKTFLNDGKVTFVQFAKTLFTGGEQEYTVQLTNIQESEINNMINFVTNNTNYKYSDVEKEQENAGNNLITLIDSAKQKLSTTNTTPSNPNEGNTSSSTESGNYDDIKDYITNFLEGKGTTPEGSSSQSGSSEGTVPKKSDSGTNVNNNQPKPGKVQVTSNGKNVSGGSENPDPNKEKIKQLNAFSTAYKSLIKDYCTAKLSAYEAIFVDRFKVLRIIANANPVQNANTTQQNNTGTATNNQ